MTHTFKVGDRVRRTGGSNGMVKQGKIYEIVSVERMWLGLKGEDSEIANFASFNFELLEASEKIEEPKDVENTHHEVPYLKVHDEFFDVETDTGKLIETVDWDKVRKQGYTGGIDYGFTADIKPKTNIMNTLSRIAKKLLDADTQSLIKAGYMDECLSITSKGREMLEEIAFDAHKTALVEAAKADIKEAEAKK